jgi:hypothetical protein
MRVSFSSHPHQHLFLFSFFFFNSPSPVKMFGGLVYFCFALFDGTGIWTEGFVYTKQVLYCLNNASTPVFLIIAILTGMRCNLNIVLIIILKIFQFQILNYTTKL